MLFSDNWCGSRVQRQRQTTAPDRDLMLCDSFLMVIVTAFVPLGGETRELVRGMFIVAGNARLGQL